MLTVTRDPHNPILSPLLNHPWEAAATFNACPVTMPDGSTSLVYRAMSNPDPFVQEHNSLSTIGIASSHDGASFADRRQLIVPSADFDRYGCEDPRVTKIDGSYYIFYTALGNYPYSADGIKIAVAVSKDMKTIQEKHLVTPFNAKAMALFPKKIAGKYAALLSINSDRPPSHICLVTFDSIEEMWSQKFWDKWYKRFERDELLIRRLENDHVELGAPPILTSKGWLVIYSHIQRYGSGDPVFGVEALLLDKDNPKKIIGKTKGPLFAPEWYYEKLGLTQNITFPSGVEIEGNTVKVHYGAADTHCAVAHIPLDTLLEMLTGTAERFVRSPKNPLLSPREGKAWEAGGVFNPAAIDLGGKVHILYRAFSDQNVSTIGYAASKDGVTIDERSEEPIYAPRADFERAGCEDPRIMQVDDRIHMLYTAYDGSVPRIAGASISVKDFLKKKWDAWSAPALVTVGNVDDKDAAILPDKKKNGYMIIHRAGVGICADFLQHLDFTKEHISKCIKILSPRFGMWDSEKIGLSTPLIKTKQGYLMLYHGISWNRKYRMGTALLDLDDPTVVLARTVAPIFEPVAPYEASGVVQHVVFPCGYVLRKGKVFIYYGGGDRIVGVATMSLAALLRQLKTATLSMPAKNVPSSMPKALRPSPRKQRQKTLL